MERFKIQLTIFPMDSKTIVEDAINIQLSEFQRKALESLNIQDDLTLEGYEDGHHLVIEFANELTEDEFDNLLDNASDSNIREFIKNRIDN